MVGAEALLRWRLPGHGDISPSHFIPLAEETSLILDIGEWVLNRVCSDYRQWQKVVPEPGRIAINLSLRQLKQASFIARCRSVFRKHEVSPTCFELEVTETTLMTDPKRTVRLLNELYSMGLHLAIVSRTLAMLRRVGVTPPVLFAGGVAHNPCIKSLLQESLGEPVLVPAHPDLVGALGAALYGEKLVVHE